tara:strand:- start:2796 stop:3152 length:357 start_codon:yes stop_codon:yes gene_type:complete
MTTLQKLQEELSQAKLNIKIAKSVTTIIEAFKNRENYTFESYTGTKRLFNSDKLFSFWDLNISFKMIKNYEELYEINFDSKPLDTKELKSAIKFFESEKKKENSNAGKIMDQMAKELI